MDQARQMLIYPIVLIGRLDLKKFDGRLVHDSRPVEALTLHVEAIERVNAFYKPHLVLIEINVEGLCHGRQERRGGYTGDKLTTRDNVNSATR